jgi:hypothetical protein
VASLELIDELGASVKVTLVIDSSICVILGRVAVDAKCY